MILSIVGFFVILYWARRSHNPHFRPRFGEVVLVSVFWLAGSVCFSFLLTGIFFVEDFSKEINSMQPGGPEPPSEEPPSDDEDD